MSAILQNPQQLQGILQHPQMQGLLQQIAPMLQQGLRQGAPNTMFPTTSGGGMTPNTMLPPSYTSPGPTGPGASIAQTTPTTPIGYRGIVNVPGHGGYGI